MLGFSRRGAVSTAAAVALLLASTSASFAGGPHRFTLRNYGYHSIVSVYISDVDTSRWGSDQLDDDQTIDPGEHVTWSWDGDCNQDIRLVYDNGHSVVTSAYDTCTYDLKSTY